MGLCEMHILCVHKSCCQLQRNSPGIVRSSSILAGCIRMCFYHFLQFLMCVVLEDHRHNVCCTSFATDVPLWFFRHAVTESAGHPTRPPWGIMKIVQRWGVNDDATYTYSFYIIHEILWIYLPNGLIILDSHNQISTIFIHI